MILTAPQPCNAPITFYILVNGNAQRKKDQSMLRGCENRTRFLWTSRQCV